MRNLILILTPLLILGIFVSTRSVKKPKTVYKINTCATDSVQVEYNCRLQNFQLKWSKPN